MKRTEILKYFASLLAAVLCGVVAFLFLSYGLSYKSLNFIALHYVLFVVLSGAVIAALTLGAILFFVFNKPTVYKLILCVLIFIDVAAIIFYILAATGFLKKINSVDALRAYIESAGGWAAVLFIVFSFLQVVLLPIPGSVAVAVGVAMFGPLKCTIFSFIGIFLGSVAAFAIGRWIGYKAVCFIVGKDDLDKWLKKMKGKDYLVLSLMFLLPMFPDDILCFVAGLSSMTWLYFIIMIIITRALSIVLSAYSFELIPFNTWWGLLVWGVIVALVVAAFWLVIKYSDKIDNFIKTKLKIKRKK